MADVFHISVLIYVIPMICSSMCPFAIPYHRLSYVNVWLTLMVRQLICNACQMFNFAMIDVIK